MYFSSPTHHFRQKELFSRVYNSKFLYPHNTTFTPDTLLTFLEQNNVPLYIFKFAVSESKIQLGQCYDYDTFCSNKSDIERKINILSYELRIEKCL